MHKGLAHEFKCNPQLEMFCVIACGDFSIFNAPSHGENAGKQHSVPDLMTPLQVSSFPHVPFQITLKSKTKREKCIPRLCGMHARSHKNNTSSGAPFSAAISNIWGKFKWEALCSPKAKEICLVPGPFLFLSFAHEWLWCGQDDWKTKQRGSV